MTFRVGVGSTTVFLAGEFRTVTVVRTAKKKTWFVFRVNRWYARVPSKRKVHSIFFTQLSSKFICIYKKKLKIDLIVG